MQIFWPLRKVDLRMHQAPPIWRLILHGLASICVGVHEGRWRFCHSKSAKKHCDESIHGIQASGLFQQNDETGDRRL